MPALIKKSLLITLEFPPQTGGVGNYYYNICKNLPADKIVVMAPAGDKTELFDREQKFPIIRLKKLTEINRIIKAEAGFFSRLAKKFSWTGLLGDIKKIVVEHKIELIQVGQILPLGTLALIMNKKTKLPYLVYTHGLDILLPQQSQHKKIIIKKIIAKAKNLIANSQFTGDELIKLGADSQKIVIVNPCPNVVSQEISEWKVNEIKEDYHLKDKKILLTVGRLVKRKGHDLVIEALPKILEKVPDTVYLIIGNGPEQKRLETLANQKSLRDQVQFLTNITDADLPAFYSACDVFVMPARQIGPDVEGFGTVYLEANLFGKPVIAGRSGGIPEAVIDRQTGLLVDPKDVEAIAEAVINLLTKPELNEKLGLQGMDRVIQNFDWQNQIEKIKNILG